MKKMGVKYPKNLALSETMSRQKFLDQLSTQPSLFQDEEREFLEKIEELKKSLFSYSESESYVFDGLCFLCMDAYDSEHTNLLLKIETGRNENIAVIERQNTPTETHYRSVLSLQEAEWIFCGDTYKEYWPSVFENIKRLAYEPPRKKALVLGKKLYIDAEPLKIDLIYEDGSSSKKLSTLTRNRTKKEIAAGIKAQPHEKQRQIVGIAIEYFKLHFAPVIEMSRQKKPGRAFIVTPPHFQLSIIDNIKRTASDMKTATETVLFETEKNHSRDF